MRPSNLLLVLLYCWPVLAQPAQQKTPADAFAAIGTWHGTFTITVRGELTFPYAGQSIKRQYKENVTGSFTLVRTDLEGGRVWSSEEGSVGGTVNVEDRVETTVPGAQAKGMYINTTRGSGGLNELVNGSKAGGFTLSLEGDTEYSVSGFGACNVKEKGWMELDGLAGKGAGMGDLLQGFGDRETDTTFHVEGSGRNSLPKQPGTLSGSSWKDEGEGGTVDFQWTLSPGQPEKGELIIAPVDPKAYAAWIPAPLKDPVIAKGTSLSIRAELKPEKGKKIAPKGRIDFYLTEVSDKPGTCGNHPQAPSSEEDLRFAVKQGDDIVVDDPKHAHTKDANKSAATVVVEATDTGAYGKLSAVAESLGLKGKLEKTQQAFLSIPLDENANHIADAWEKAPAVNVYDKKYEEKWDGEMEPKSDSPGDGISLYQEYRGFVVLKNKVKTFQHLDPSVKELFVIDDDGQSDAAAWKAASRTEMLYVDRSLIKDGDVNSRIVDFNGDREKYCIWIDTQKGMDDPLEHTDPKASTCYTLFNSPVRSPKDILRIRIFPDRMRNGNYEAYKQAVENGLDGTWQDSADVLKELAKANGWSEAVMREKALAAIEAWRENTKLVVPEAIRWILVHELAHACTAPGHQRPQPGGGTDESTKGNQSCPMCYPGAAFKTRIVMGLAAGLPIPRMLGRTTFCLDDPDRCLEKLHIKDN